MSRVEIAEGGRRIVIQSYTQTTSALIRAAEKLWHATQPAGRTEPEPEGHSVVGFHTELAPAPYYETAHPVDLRSNR